MKHKLTIAFRIPSTRLVRVEYKGRESRPALYSAVIPNPQDNYNLQTRMLMRKIGISQIVNVFPVHD